MMIIITEKSRESSSGLKVEVYLDEFDVKAPKEEASKRKTQNAVRLQS